MLTTRPSRHGGRWRRVSARRHADARAGLRLLAVADRLDVVAVGIEDERPIVVFVIMPTQPRWPVVLSPGRERRLLKLLHGFPVLGREAHVGTDLRSVS